MKHGGTKTTPEKKLATRTLRHSILDDIMERDSLSSGSLEARYSEKHRLEPAKFKEQVLFKSLQRQKEAMTQIDDAKLSRDHKRHFMVSRAIGHDLYIPGASSW